MPVTSHTDAIVVGAGPNGLAAAIMLARAGKSVRLVEAAATIGGGTRTRELTLPGFWHDICAAVHPLAMASPFFRSIPLSDYGLEWVHSPASLAHPMDGGQAVLLKRSITETSAQLGTDLNRYNRIMKPLTARWQQLVYEFLGPLRFPRHPFTMAGFGFFALWPAATFARLMFREKQSRGLFAGLAAHSIQPLENLTTVGFGLLTGVLGHAVGWPVARGGSERIAGALADYLRTLNGEIVVGHPVQSLDELPPAKVILLDIGPRQLIRIAGSHLPASYVRRLEKYRYGPGVFKIDYALDGPIPWENPECVRAITVHLGNTLEEISESERQAYGGIHQQKPFVILSQASLFDDSRAPHGNHTVWAYCHVPNNSTIDMTIPIEAQIERFAPGFQQRILARHCYSAVEMEQYNPNYVGGDINAGVQDIRQLFTRPVARWVPYSTPIKGLYLCSSSTPPGGGVHGMCGYYAARAALKYAFNS